MTITNEFAYRQSQINNYVNTCNKAENQYQRNKDLQAFDNLTKHFRKK